MAIESNASTEVVQGGGIQLYSGISNFKVIAVNPTMAELHALDINVKSEPNYALSTSFGDRTKITFWLQNEDITTKLDILISPEVRETKAGGKFQWINSTGQTTWADENGPNYDWWNAEGQRKAYIGEETLIFFTTAWANVATGGKVSYETMKDIVNGDVREIKGLIAALKDNMVRVLVGVKDDKYQTIYTKYFGRIKPQRDDMFIRMLKDDYGSFNADFNADLKWGEHNPTADGLVTPDALNEEDDWVFPDKPQGETVKEESPF